MLTGSLHLDCSKQKEGDKMNRERIRQRRRQLGLSMQELGEAVGVSRVMIYYIEVGSRTPSIDTITKIANALNIPLSEILKGEKDK